MILIPHTFLTLFSLFLFCFFILFYFFREREIILGTSLQCSYNKVNNAPVGELTLLLCVWTPTHHRAHTLSVMPCGFDLESTIKLECTLLETRTERSNNQSNPGLTALPRHHYFTTLIFNSSSAEFFS